MATIAKNWMSETADVEVLLTSPLVVSAFDTSNGDEHMRVYTKMADRQVWSNGRWRPVI